MNRTEKRGLSPIPVLVLTGALGAGKTTLLNAALRSGAITNAAVVVNEFGAVGIDNELIEASGEDVVLLPGGCVCCEVRADLAEALLRLERSVAHGKAQRFARVILETSGLADPAPILQLFAESPLLVGRYRLEALVTVIDAQFGAAELAREGTARSQALLADRLIVTKSEFVTVAALEALEVLLAGINAHADLVRALRGAAEASWFGPSRIGAARLVPADSMRAAHDEAVESFVLGWEAPQPLAAIGAWLHGLAQMHGTRLLRVKGIVAVAEDSRAVAVHAIQHVVAPPEFLSLPAGASRVVFIARGLEPGDVRPAWPTAAQAAPGQPRSRAASKPILPQATGASSGAAAPP